MERADLSGERVLVLNDHGFGDTIQFFRYLPVMAAAGVNTTFVCPPRLMRLLSSKTNCASSLSPPDGEPSMRKSPSAACRMRLARGSRLSREVPYLAAEPPVARDMGEAHRRGRFQDRRRVAGQPGSRGGPRPLVSSRSVRAARRVSGRAAYLFAEGLRRGAARQTAAFDARRDAGAGFRRGGLTPSSTPPPPWPRCDLIVTCDTSIAHLAGALGQPVWVALKDDAEWRWLTERADSPWYPTMRLFRQRTGGDWREVFEAMAARSRGARCAPDSAASARVGALFARRTHRQDDDPAHQGRTRIGEHGKTREHPPRTSADCSNASQKSAVFHAGPIDWLVGRKLAAVNARLWTIEDSMRACEREGDFGPRFIALARSVYAENDQRAALKRAINRLTSSGIR